MNFSKHIVIVVQFSSMVYCEVADQPQDKTLCVMTSLFATARGSVRIRTSPHLLDRVRSRG